MNKTELVKLFEENNINVDIDKEVDSMKKIGCYYFSMPYNNGMRLTIDLREFK